MDYRWGVGGSRSKAYYFWDLENETSGKRLILTAVQILGMKLTDFEFGENEFDLLFERDECEQLGKELVGVI